MNVPGVVMILSLVLAADGTAVAQGKRAIVAEQTEFSAEDEGMKRPVLIPEDVLAILRTDDAVRKTMENADPPLEKLPPSWFSASVVHLAGPEEEDLIVRGEGEMQGGNVVLFWVFRPTPHGYVLALTAPAHDLEVKRKRWRGVREIEMSGETAVMFTAVQFRWDGKRFVKFRERSNDMR